MSLRDLPDSPPPTRTRHSGTVWALARQDYLAGGSAVEVCERHGLALSTFRWRAREEGWRLKDQADSPIDAPFSAAHAASGRAPRLSDVEYEDLSWPPETRDPHWRPDPAAWPDARPGTGVEPTQDDPLPDTLAPAAGLADTAWRHADRAIARGRLTEARNWLRVHEHLLRMANRVRWQSVQHHEAAICPVPPAPDAVG